MVDSVNVYSILLSYECKILLFNSRFFFGIYKKLDFFFNSVLNYMYLKLKVDIKSLFFLDMYLEAHRVHMYNKYIGEHFFMASFYKKKRILIQLNYYWESSYGVISREHYYINLLKDTIFIIYLSNK